MKTYKLNKDTISFILYPKLSLLNFVLESINKVLKNKIKNEN